MNTALHQDAAPLHPWDPAIIGDRHVAAFLKESFGQHVLNNPAYRQAMIDLTTAVNEAELAAACA